MYPRIPILAMLRTLSRPPSAVSIITGMFLELGIGLQPGEHLHSVHDRHRDIEEDEVGLSLGGDRETFDAVASLEDLAVEGLEGLPDDEADGLGIVDREDFMAHGRED